MKQRAENIFSFNIPLGCLIYGNNPSVEDYIALELLPQRLWADKVEVKTFTELDLLNTSKENLYLETSLFEVSKLYIIRDVTDKFIPLLQAYKGTTPLIMIGKNLKSSSKIVNYVSEHPVYQTIPIYGEETSFLTTFIHHQLKDYQKEVGVERLILNHLESFAEVHRQVNLLKQVYPFPEHLTLEKIEKVLIPTEDVAIFKVAEAIVGKNPKAMIAVFEKTETLFQKEIVPLLRIIAKQFWDLVKLRHQIDQGISASQAVSKAVPLIPFNRRPQIIHNLSKWTVKGLLNAIITIDEMEILAKQPSLFSSELIQRHFLQMTKL